MSAFLARLRLSLIHVISFFRSQLRCTCAIRQINESSSTWSEIEWSTHLRIRSHDYLMFSSTSSSDGALPSADAQWQLCCHYLSITMCTYAVIGNLVNWINSFWKRQTFKFMRHLGLWLSCEVFFVSRNNPEWTCNSSLWHNNFLLRSIVGVFATKTRYTELSWPNYRLRIVG